METDMTNPSDGYLPGGKNDGNNTNNTFYTGKKFRGPAGRVDGTLAERRLGLIKTPMNLKKIKVDQGRLRQKFGRTGHGF
jgi:hypothetical protein